MFSQFLVFPVFLPLLISGFQIFSMTNGICHTVVVALLYHSIEVPGSRQKTINKAGEKGKKGKASCYCLKGGKGRPLLSVLSPWTFFEIYLQRCVGAMPIFLVHRSTNAKKASAAGIIKVGPKTLIGGVGFQPRRRKLSFVFAMRVGLRSRKNVRRLHLPLREEVSSPPTLLLSAAAMGIIV